MSTTSTILRPWMERLPFLTRHFIPGAMLAGWATGAAVPWIGVSLPRHNLRMDPCGETP